jgi:hypothetical protein
MLKRLALAAAASIPAVAGLSAPVSADHRCMSRPEYRGVRDVLTQYQVYRLVDVWGRVVDTTRSGSNYLVPRRYPTCGGGPAWVYFSGQSGQRPRVIYNLA